MQRDLNIHLTGTCIMVSICQVLHVTVDKQNFVPANSLAKMANAYREVSKKEQSRAQFSISGQGDQHINIKSIFPFCRNLSSMNKGCKKRANSNAAEKHSEGVLKSAVHLTRNKRSKVLSHTSSQRKHQVSAGFNLPKWKQGKSHTPSQQFPICSQVHAIKSLHEKKSYYIYHSGWSSLGRAMTTAFAE